MDMNTLRSIATVVCFGIFLGILWWACRPANGKRFEEAAMLPFMLDEFTGEETGTPAKGPQQ